MSVDIRERIAAPGTIAGSPADVRDAFADGGAVVLVHALTPVALGQDLPIKQLPSFTPVIMGGAFGNLGIDAMAAVRGGFPGAIPDIATIFIGEHAADVYKAYVEHRLGGLALRYAPAAPEVARSGRAKRKASRGN